MEEISEVLNEELKIIAEACINDDRILEIVTSISKMSETERDNFKSKITSYFMKKNSKEDMEAYKFYKLILENSNAHKVIELYSKIVNSK
ncbi:hypothetical protein IM41_02415 [Fervidobacterium sp. SC_NGM5_G05]|nr:hypothetical protein IM41_02415 [Fervidobacterium sp. SC_NGM5_G05]